MAVNEQSNENRTGDWVSKVPQVALMFWVIKILATTVGETGGDAVTMTLQLGYAVGSLIFLGFFAVTLAAQVASKRYHPFFYWAVVVATTTVGTTMSDYLDRTIGLGYIKSSIILFIGVLLVLFVWHRVTGKIEFANITTKKEEIFYWLTILVSNTLGTALGELRLAVPNIFEGVAVLVEGDVMSSLRCIEFGFRRDVFLDEQLRARACACGFLE